MTMARLAQMWDAYLNLGSHHFHTATELKLNRVLNLLFSLNFIANGFLILAELAILLILLQRDAGRYINYIIPFGSVNVIHPLLIAAIFYLKNKYGTFRVTFLSNVVYTAYCVILCLFLGEKVGIHLILMSVIPIVFIMYDYGRWIDISLHAFIMTAGIAVALTSYKTMAPLYPLPDDIAEVAGYLCWFAALALLFIYSIFNWRQVHLTEKQLADEKDQTKQLLNETIPKLEIAEAKYRHLVDDSRDLIFQMDENAVILSMNARVRTMLGYHPEEMIGRKLYEFVPDGLEGDPDLNRNIVRERLREFAENHGQISFRTTLRKKHMFEPVDVHIVLQKNLVHWKIEIVGKVSGLEEDAAQRFLEKEKGRYIIGNNVTQAEILSQKLTDRLNRFFTAPVVNTIRICFREILVNAIEHGNLGITFDQKSQAIEKGDYMEFLLSRQQDKKFAHRRVYVDYLINGRILMFRVTDDGDGFDHASFLDRARNDPYLSMLEHGRGIIMTKSVFDSVVFNDKGNQVILTRKIPQ